MSVRIDPMAPDHLDAVVALEQQVQPRPWSRGIFEDELARSDRRYLTAWDGDDLVGFAGLWTAPGVAPGVDEVHVTTVAVAPSHRRRGVAGALVVDLLDGAVAAGATAATLEVRAGNAAARQLYAGMGFAPVGVRPGYYDGEDAIIMWLHDLGGADATARRDRRRLAAHAAGGEVAR